MSLFFIVFINCFLKTNFEEISSEYLTLQITAVSTIIIPLQILFIIKLLLTIRNS